MFPENKTGKCFFPLSTIKKLHAEIVFVAWQRDLSREVKIVYLFFQENTSRKFLSLLLFYFPVFRLQISSASAIIFAECHGPSCVYVWGSWYIALSLVSLSGVGLRCVGLAQKISARCKRASNTGSYGFFFFLICIFILSLALSHMYVFFIPSARSLRFGSRLWKVNIDQKWKLFYQYLFQRAPVIYNFISQESVFLFAINFH